MILVDTNLLCRVCNPVKPPSPHTLAARHALQKLRNQGHELAITTQNIHEFWATATRPPGAPPTGGNGLGMTVERADMWVAYFLRIFRLLADSPDSLPIWRSLVVANRITGHKSHDVRLVAAMQGHQVGDILTFNGADFKRFAGINIIDPRSV